MNPVTNSSEEFEAQRGCGGNSKILWLDRDDVDDEGFLWFFWIHLWQIFCRNESQKDGSCCIIADDHRRWVAAIFRDAHGMSEWHVDESFVNIGLGERKWKKWPHCIHHTAMFAGSDMTEVKRGEFNPLDSSRGPQTVLIKIPVT